MTIYNNPNYENQNYNTYEYTDYEYTPFGDSAFGYGVEDELFNRKTEEELFRLFEELDGLVLDNLPASLVTEPARLIQREYYQKTGLFLTKQEIVDAYLRFAEGEFYE